MANHFSSGSTRVYRFVGVYILTVVIFVLQKPIFMLLNDDVYGSVCLDDRLAVMLHGLPLDLSIAGYLTVIPGLLLLASLWFRGKLVDGAFKVYYLVVSLLLGSIFWADSTLYGYWGFKLDSTPLFYFATSPSSALASVSAGFIISRVVFALGYSALLFGLYWLLFRVTPLRPVRNIGRMSLVLLLLTGALFLPIRGGVTVSTMNLSRVYFSGDRSLNHAAVNPAFSLMYSLTHLSDFGNTFRYMPDAEARQVFDDMMNRGVSAHASVDTTLLSVARPDIYIVILESFSTHLMPSLGGEPVALRLDSIASEATLFSNFYASSFRTDRGIPAILSGYPGQPTTSVMKHVEKAENLPSLSSALISAGYQPSYYYGGDINFTNQLAYLRSSGFEHIVCDKDFPLIERTGKWGAHDHLVFGRVADDVSADNSSSPKLRVIQTSSSHEPFEVPYRNPRYDNPKTNAFAYTDSCVAAFVGDLHRLGKWDTSLVVLVPDHYGAYPEGLKGEAAHRIPLVITGGAFRHRGVVDTYASQIDIATTLLSMLGLDSSQFVFGHDAFDPSEPHFAIYSGTDYVGISHDGGSLIWDCETGRVASSSGESSGDDMRIKAWLQTLYDNLQAL